MKRDEDTSSTDYARAIERRWAALVDRPLVLSRRDWVHVSRWHNEGVPLELIEEALLAAVQPERGRGPRALAQIASVVEESWSLIRQGRRATDSIEYVPPRPDPRDAWRDCLAREPPGSALSETLTRLLDRLDRGEEPGELDRELDRTLADVVPADLVDRILGELETDLAPFSVRLSPERLLQTRKRAAEKRLRQALRLPRLASTRPAG